MIVKSPSSNNTIMIVKSPSLLVQTWGAAIFVSGRRHVFFRAPVDAKHGGALKKTWRRPLTKMARPLTKMAAPTNKDGDFPIIIV